LTLKTDGSFSYAGKIFWPPAFLRWLPSTGSKNGSWDINCRVSYEAGNNLRQSRQTREQPAGQVSRRW